MISVVSLNVCQVVGTRGENSTALAIDSTVIRLEVSDSHITHPNTITPTILINLPEDLTIFHVVIASG